MRTSTHTHTSTHAHTCAWIFFFIYNNATLTLWRTHTYTFTRKHTSKAKNYFETRKPERAATPAFEIIMEFGVLKVTTARTRCIRLRLDLAGIGAWFSLSAAWGGKCTQHEVSVLSATKKKHAEKKKRKSKEIRRCAILGLYASHARGERERERVQRKGG